MVNIGVPAGAAQGRGRESSVTAAVRSYYSTVHLWSARHFARLAGDFERSHAGATRIFLQHRSYVTSAVMESVAFMESFINETYADAAAYAATGERGPAIAGLAAERLPDLATYWAASHKKASALEKYKEARKLLGADRADAGGSLYQCLQSLIDFRGWLIHEKPETVSADAPAPQLSGFRRDPRVKGNPFLEHSGAPHFLDHVMSADYASWAAEAVFTFADDFMKTTRGTRDHHRLEHDEQP